jgi:hypothetical protein
MLKSSAFAAFAVLSVLAASPCGAEDTAVNEALWRPASHVRWQLQYTGRPLDLRVETNVFKVDLFDTRPALVRDLRKHSKHVVCYMNVGAWEDWRPDAARFPRATLGNAYEGWPGERWLDIRRIEPRPR